MAKSKKELAVARLLRESASDHPPLTVEEATAMVETKERKKELDAKLKHAKQLMKKAENDSMTNDERAEYDQLMEGGFDSLIDQYVAIANVLFQSSAKR